MGALENVKKSLKKSVIGLMLGSSFGAFVSMVNLTGEVDEISVEAAVENTIKENKGDEKLAKGLNNFIKIAEISDKVLEEKAENQFNTSNALEIELNSKDEDGYNKIEDKVTNSIKAKVSEKEAVENSGKARKKGGKPRTRVDED